MSGPKWSDVVRRGPKCDTLPGRECAGRAVQAGDVRGVYIMWMWMDVAIRTLQSSKDGAVSALFLFLYGVLRMSLN